MKFRIVNLLLVCSSLTACGQGTPATLIPVTITPVPPSRTPSPTRTPVPTVTPFPPLSGLPPYLVLKPDYEVPQFMIYDHDGTGRRVLELPEGGKLRSLSGLDNYISPDGRWLAFHKGTVSIGGDPEDLPVSLYILNIIDGTSMQVAEVVTQGYAEKLEKVTEGLKELDPKRYAPIDNTDWVAGEVAATFKWSIYSMAWSPDSQHLAFAAQIDGDSSDVYVYDIESKNIQRLNDDVQNVSAINWSPDGKYIVYENSRPGMVYTGSSLHAVKFGSPLVQNPATLQEGTWWSAKGWLSPTILLASQGTDTAGNFDLHTIDIASGRVRHLWEDGFISYALDRENQIIAINSSEFSEPENRGLYFISFDGKPQKVFEGLYWLSLCFRGGEKHRFLATGASHEAQYDLAGDLVGITTDAQPTFFGKFDVEHLSVSPDRTWLLLYDDQHLYLYNELDELEQTFSISDVDQIAWRPDSQGIFYSTGRELYFLSIPDGTPTFVDECSTDACRFALNQVNIAWLP